jgi:hypothetical protein
MAGLDPSGLDGDWTPAWLDQHSNHSQRDLLRVDYAHGHYVSALGQRQGATRFFQFEFHIPSESAASATFSHEISILDHCTEVQYGRVCNGIVGVHDRTEKVLAAAHHRSIAHARDANRVDAGVCCRPLRIHIVLR